MGQDYDGDGYSSADEFLSLSDLSISSINTGYTESSFVDDQGNEHRQVGGFTWSDGTSGAATDVWFKADKMYTIAEEWLDIPEDIAALPDLQGYGNVYDLHQAMVRDTSGELKTLVENFMAEADPSIRNNLLEQILFNWTGSEGIDPESRGPYIDARRLAVLEKLFGEGFVGTQGPNPHHGSAKILNQSYRGIFEMFYAGLMAQTHLKDFYDKIIFTWDEATQSLRGDLSEVITELQNQIAIDSVAGKEVLGEFARTLCGFDAEDMVDYVSIRNTFAAQSEELAWVIDTAGNVFVGTIGNDSIFGNGTPDHLYGYGGNDVLYGMDGDDLIEGGEGTDYLYGGVGNDFLNGGRNNDYLYGETGSDTYLFSRGSGQDTIYEYDPTPGNMDTLWFASDVNRSDVEMTRYGNDMIFRIKGTSEQVVAQYWMLDPSYQLERVEFGDGVVLTAQEVTDLSADIRGTEYGDNLMGSSVADRLYGYGGDDVLYGMGGDDLMDGGEGNDFLSAGDGNDILYGQPGADYLSGGYGDDTLDGGLDNDYLNGDVGSDTYLFGRGSGQDTIYNYDPTPENIDTLRFAQDIPRSDVEITRYGNDMVFRIKGTSDEVKVQYWMMGSEYQLERVEFGDGAVLTGQEVTDSTVDIYGTSYSETLQGSLAADRIYGYEGNDTLYGNAGDDLIDGGEGNDFLSGGDGNDMLYGQAGGDWLYGGAGDDTLDGGSDNDYLYGEMGNDTYVVDNVGDTVTEAPNEGIDTVKSSITYTLGTNVENLTLTGTAAINGTGNELNNVLTGNGAANILNGGAGADTMVGGAGNDTFVVDNTGDTVVENTNQGTDTVQSSVTFILAANVENLTLTGAASINGTGNTLNNVLTGNSASNILTGSGGNDTLNGGAGGDTLIGGLGNDTYVIDNTGDIVTEVLNEGTDTVKSYITYTLGANVENLTLMGTGAVNGTGNGLNNIITGNSGNNILSGGSGNDSLKAGAGADTLDGGAGNDYLEGSTGNDLYLFGRGYGQDTIKDYDTASGNTDTVKSNSGLNPIDLIFAKSGNNLKIQINNSSDLLTVQNQNDSTAYHAEVFEVSDGNRLLASSVNLLIQAMAEFSAENNGMSWTQLIQEKPTDVQQILAQYWQPPQ